MNSSASALREYFVASFGHIRENNILLVIFQNPEIIFIKIVVFRFYYDLGINGELFRDIKKVDVGDSAGRRNKETSGCQIVRTAE